jgi:hypothetical protein
MILRFFVDLGFERATWRKNEVGGEIPESPLDFGWKRIGRSGQSPCLGFCWRKPYPKIDFGRYRTTSLVDPI